MEYPLPVHFPKWYDMASAEANENMTCSRESGEHMKGLRGLVCRRVLGSKALFYFLLRYRWEWSNA